MVEERTNFIKVEGSIPSCKKIFRGGVGPFSAESI